MLKPPVAPSEHPRFGAAPLSPSPPGWAGRLTPFRVAVAGVLAITLVRLVVLFTTPLELYPDEAQYWLWSRHLSFGYFSKPPMVAWLIALTTGVGGNAEPWVRLSAPLLHAGAALALQRAGARIYNERTGLWAAAVYALMPAVQLSSTVVATDAPLLFFLSLALWSYATVATARSPREADRAALAFATCLAVGCLAKYAAAYGVAGALLHAAWAPGMRARWTARRLATAVSLGLLIVAPNLIWNASHHFQTLQHTAANADWRAAGAEGRPANLADHLLDPRGLFGFLLAQTGVFGPVFFVTLVGGLVWGLRRARAKAAPDADRLLISFIAPPLGLVLAQAVISRANANWAAPAYVPAAVLAAAWLIRWGRRDVLVAGLALQAALAGLFLAAVVSPMAATALHSDNSFKVARGWRASTDWVLAQAETQAAAGGLDAIAVDDRFLFNALSYYGRGRAWPAPLRMWVREIRPRNQAETEAPLTPASGRRVLMVDVWDRYREEAARDFGQAGLVIRTTVPLDAHRGRALTAFAGQGFAPRPRDPVSGLPTPP